LPPLENGELSIVLAMIAVGQWWLFDRSTHGFVLGLVIAFAGTIASQIIVHVGAYRSGLSLPSHPTFL